MGIVTKTGDEGTTCLGSGRRVAKDHIALEVCGALDELGSCLGVAKSLVKNAAMRRLIDSIQRDLFVIGAEAGCGGTSVNRLKKRIGGRDAAMLDTAIVDIERKRPFEVRSFSVAGGTLASAIMDMARTVARRAERRMVTLKKRSLLRNRYCLIYMNRLSNLLFLLARRLEKKAR